MLRDIKIDQRLPRMLAFKVTGTGTAAINVGSLSASLTDNGTGDYTITFNEAFKRIPVVVATAMTAGLYAEVAAASATACQILLKTTAANVATDGIVNVIVLGFDDADEY